MRMHSGGHSTNTKTGLAIATFIGLVFLSFSFLFIPLAFNTNKGWVKTNGTVISVAPQTGSKGGTTYQPTISYRDSSGIEHSITSNISESGVGVGDTRTVYYNPQNPSEANAKSGGLVMLFLLVFPLVGLILLITSWWGFIKSRRLMSLKGNGQPLQAVIHRTGINTQDNSVTALAAMPDGTSKEFVVKGLGMREYISLGTTSDHIPVTVYIDRTDASKYYVDLSSLPKINADTIHSLIKQQSELSQPQATPAYTAEPTHDDKPNDNQQNPPSISGPIISG